MSQYRDLQDALSDLLGSIPYYRGVSSRKWICPICSGMEPDIGEDDTDPGERGPDNVIHVEGCARVRAERLWAIHETPLSERADLVEALDEILARKPSVLEDIATWRDRTARAILAAVDLRVRHRQPERKPR